MAVERLFLRPSIRETKVLQIMANNYRSTCVFLLFGSLLFGCVSQPKKSTPAASATPPPTTSSTNASQALGSPKSAADGAKRAKPGSLENAKRAPSVNESSRPPTQASAPNGAVPAIEPKTNLQGSREAKPNSRPVAKPNKSENASLAAPKGATTQLTKVETDLVKPQVTDKPTPQVERSNSAIAPAPDRRPSVTSATPSQDKPTTPPKPTAEKESPTKGVAATATAIQVDDFSKPDAATTPNSDLPGREQLADEQEDLAPESKPEDRVSTDIETQSVDALDSEGIEAGVSDANELSLDSSDPDSGDMAVDTRIAMIDKKPSEPGLSPDLQALDYDIEHLPRTLPGGWVLDIRPDPLSKQQRCLLYSPKAPIHDGYDDSSIQLQVTNDAVVIKSDSNLDSSYPDQGLQVDQGALVPFATTPLSERVTYTEKPIQLAMASGSKLQVSLGFWPTWPMTQTQSTVVDLAGFHGAYAALKACIAAQ